MIKTLKKYKTVRELPNPNKGERIHIIISIKLNGTKLNAFPIKWEIMQECSFPLFFNIILDLYLTRQEKE